MGGNESLSMGGSRESTGKITRRCLTFTKGRSISEEVLVTFSTGVEAPLNSRLLTQLSDDINDFNVLTPNHFILGKKPLYFNPEMIKDNYVTSKVPWKVVQALTKMFWRRVVQ